MMELFSSKKVVDGAPQAVADISTPENLETSTSTKPSPTSVKEADVKVGADEVGEADLAAGVATVHPANYIKLGAKVPFRCPRVPEDVTPGWLTTALRYRGLLSETVKVSDVSYRLLSGGVMGVIALLGITYDGETSAPTSMVAKFSPPGKAPLPSFVVRAIFKAESHFYNDFSMKASGIVRSPSAECRLCLPRWSAGCLPIGSDGGPSHGRCGPSATCASTTRRAASRRFARCSRVAFRRRATRARSAARTPSATCK